MVNVFKPGQVFLGPIQSMSAVMVEICIARTIVVKPAIILIDEPASALDPVATMKIEDLMRQLTEEYTIIIVTHNKANNKNIASLVEFFKYIGWNRKPCMLKALFPRIYMKFASTMLI